MADRIDYKLPAGVPWPRTRRLPRPTERRLGAARDRTGSGSSSPSASSPAGRTTSSDPRSESTRGASRCGTTPRWHHTEIPYYRHVLAGRLPEDSDLRDHTFSTGFRWTVVEPLPALPPPVRGRGRVRFDLEWDAIMDPWVPPRGNPPSHAPRPVGSRHGRVRAPRRDDGGRLLRDARPVVADHTARERTAPFWGGEINNGWMAAAADASTAFFGTKWIVLDGHLSPVVESEVRRGATAPRLPPPDHHHRPRRRGP